MAIHRTSSADMVDIDGQKLKDLMKKKKLSLKTASILICGQETVLSHAVQRGRIGIDTIEKLESIGIMLDDYKMVKEEAKQISMDDIALVEEKVSNIVTLTDEQIDRIGDRVVDAICNRYIPEKTEAKSEWVRLGDGVPADRQLVMITQEFENHDGSTKRTIGLARYRTAWAAFTAGKNNTIITNVILAWMPLPPAYDGE